MVEHTVEMSKNEVWKPSGVSLSTYKTSRGKNKMKFKLRFVCFQKRNIFDKTFK